MGFVIWYRVVLAQQPPAALPATGGVALPPVPFLSISNDLYGGTYTLDADIDIALYEGDLASTFVVRVTDLPASVSDALKQRAAAAIRARRPLLASIHLGYFDDVPLLTQRTAVITGALTGVKRSDAGEHVVTELRGQELAAWKLLAYERATFTRRGPMLPVEAVRAILSRAGDVPQRGAVSGGEARTDFVLSAPTGLAALGEVARWAGARFAVRDGAVCWQPPGPVGELGAPLIKGRNIVKLDDDLRSERPRPRARDAQPANDRPDQELYRSYELTVLGIPALRPGQTLPVTTDGPPRMLHAEQVTHSFSSSAGYVCTLALADDGDGPPLRLAPRGAPRVVQRMRELAGRDQRTFVDVGELTAYEPGKDGKHLVTVNYGQRPGDDVVAPSVETPVSRESQLHSRPISSPFAWHKVGLIVPAYPGQRALLAHNRGDANDAAVAGYLWSEDPAMERPQNEPGDWWLCLPTRVSGGRPDGRGVNDLIDASGLRAIQAAGLSIAVGGRRLADVGARPQVPDAETLTIEHAAGTTIAIDRDGKVEIRTDARAIAITNGRAALRLDDGSAELTNGSVTVRLSGSAVEIS